jgi:mannan endo-1,4-beta-mannosidase
MIRSSKRQNALRALLSASIALGLSGCLGGEPLNTNEAVYTPEQKPLNVIAAENIEVKPGDTVKLTSRLVGTVSGQTVLWSQVEGPAVVISDLTASTITFDVPESVLSAKLVFQVAVMDANGAQVMNSAGGPLMDVVEVTVFDPDSVIVLDVSDTTTTLNSATLVRPGDDAYIAGANGDVHTADLAPGQSVTFNIDGQPGFYTFNVRYVIPADYGGKMANALVNGVKSEFALSATGQWGEIRVGIIQLQEGANTIEVGGGWGYYRIDGISLIPAAQPAGPLPVAPDLVNPNATAATVDLMTYLTSNYGTATLSGQTEFPSKVDGTFPLIEFDKIVAATNDDAPAIVAFDYMNYSASYAGSDASGLTEAMIAAHNDKNVILSALFHWRAPSGNPDSGDGKFYTADTTFDLAAALADTGSAEYASLLADIDTVAMELKKLADADIPVLWRPLHEAQGKWFWWGAAGPEALKQLWILMYDRMTNMHGLNNLIWVFTHTQSMSQDWYPGDNYVDIVGYDGYAEPKNDANDPFSSQYSTLKNRHNGKKLVGLTETGTIPNVSAMHENNAWWSFFITWNSETWNSSSVIGPQGAAAADIDANYAYDKLINLADIPGGRDKVEAGVYQSFDVSTAEFKAQLSWSPTDGITTSDSWASSGSRSLSVKKDLSAEASPTNVIMQVYPTGGIDVSGVTMLSLDAHAIDAGVNTTIKLFAKDGDGVWRDAGATNIAANGINLTIDVSDLDTLQGFGLQIENFDLASTAAEFLLDNVRLDDVVIYDFEPDSSGFRGQVNWGNTPGITVTKGWSASGNRALTIIKDLSAIDGVNNVIFQTYPAGGIDVTGVSMLKLNAHAIDAGMATTIKLWAKDGDGVWRDNGATVIAADGLELSLDVSDLDVLQGFGLQIENFDVSSSAAKFYLDNVRLDDDKIYDFEGTGGWEFQVNWSPTTGIQLASDWTVSGENSLSGVTQLVDGDDNIILQVYPQGGLLLGAVSTLKVTAYSKDAGDSVQVQLFAKNKDSVWRDGGAVALSAEGTELSLDISDMGEISGFGVRFMGAQNSATESQYFIDNVVFE